MPARAPLRIALTGGIASGKTAVSNRFAARAVPVIDADVAARKVVAPGSAGLTQLSALCGADILQGNGELNRRALRQRMFSEPSLREQVNAILHPLIRAEMRAQANAQPAPYQMFVIPLLVETGQASDYDRVLLVSADEAIRIKRVMARDQIDEAAARSILAAQASDTRRLEVADDVIDNNGDELLLDEQVESLHRRYLQLAQQSTTGS